MVSCLMIPLVVIAVFVTWLQKDCYEDRLCRGSCLFCGRCEYIPLSLESRIFGLLCLSENNTYLCVCLILIARRIRIEEI